MSVRGIEIAAAAPAVPITVEARINTRVEKINKILRPIFISNWAQIPLDPKDTIACYNGIKNLIVYFQRAKHIIFDGKDDLDEIESSVRILNDIAIAVLNAGKNNQFVHFESKVEDDAAFTIFSPKLCVFSLSEVRARAKKFITPFKVPHSDEDFNNLANLAIRGTVDSLYDDRNVSVRVEIRRIKEEIRPRLIAEFKGVLPTDLEARRFYDAIASSPFHCLRQYIYELETRMEKEISRRSKVKCATYERCRRDSCNW